jgi:hypothetical protein
MKQAIREQLERKQNELKEEPMAEANDVEVKDLLKLLLEEKAAEAKEKQEKRAIDAAKRLADAKQMAESARQKADLDRRKREFCLHSVVHPATKQRSTAWIGQVNSDGYIVPLCNLCSLEMPKIKASDDQRANGARFHEYSAEQLSVKVFENAHRNAFPQGCERDMCYLCHPVKFPETCGKDECHFCNSVTEAVAV